MKSNKTFRELLKLAPAQVREKILANMLRQKSPEEYQAIMSEVDGHDGNTTICKAFWWTLTLEGFDYWWLKVNPPDWLKRRKS